MHKLIMIVITLWSCLSTYAAVLPARIFTDYTVLQQGEPVRIWGTAAVGEKVTVTFADQAKNAVADPDGKWMVALDPMPACAQGRPLIFRGSESAQPVTLNDVLVGEVWLAGGQSNMETPLASYRKTTQAEIDSANDPLLRMMTIPRLAFAGENQDRTRWKTAMPQYVPSFSAGAYYFAKKLRETLNVPVGIVCCSYGATPAEAWMSRRTLESNSDLNRILEAYEAGCRKTFSGEEDCRKQHEDYLAAVRENHRRVAAGEPAGPYPVEPMGPLNYMRPCGLYETMLSQTIPYTLRGVIWYQGENNANWQTGYHYRTVFPALIQEWREEFQNKNLPFLFVQLATYGPASDVSPLWPELRESQGWTEDHVANCGMAVLVDGGEENNIHPHSKDKVGDRLARLALNMVYGEKELVCRGPRLKTSKCEKGFIELTFTDTGSGLVLNSAAVGAFEICGADGNYVPAEAKAAGGKIFVSSRSVPEPKNVRYGWKKWFIPTLFNNEGLPASPFRTDDFPPFTKDRYYLDRL
jgi:sialate O-acetylesterase